MRLHFLLRFMDPTIFFFKDTPTTEIYTYLHTLSLHDAPPIYGGRIPALLEFEDIFDLGMAPGVNQLILVADNGDVRIVAKNLPKQIFLPAVGVLIFVDQDVFESPADLTDDII